MSYVLHDGSDRVEITGPGEPSRAALGRTFRDPADAVAFLRGLRSDDSDLAVLRKLLWDLQPGLDVSRLDDQQVLEEAARCLAGGDAQVASPGAAAELIRGGAEVEPREAEPEQPAAGPQTSWIKFKVVDDETGEPIPDVKLEVRLPNGNAREYSTRPDGMIEVDEIDPGTCDILKMTDEQALEVVRVE
jgi:hypothetical protein